jgi:hypothetical protein
MKRINKEFNKVLDPLFEKRGKILYQLTKGWSQIVGNDRAIKTSPFKISVSNGNTILYIKCSSAGVATELFYHEPAMVEKIALFIGKEIITKIKVQVKNSNEAHNVRKEASNMTCSYHAPLFVKEKIQMIEDMHLSKALEEYVRVFKPLR